MNYAMVTSVVAVLRRSGVRYRRSDCGSNVNRQGFVIGITSIVRTLGYERLHLFGASM